jgi:hypothetical protein
MKFSNQLKQLRVLAALTLGVSLLGVGLQKSATADIQKTGSVQPPATSFEINKDSAAPQIKELVAGPVKVVIDLAKSIESYGQYPFRYQLFYNGVQKSSFSTSTSISGTVQLKDLTDDRVPEVIVETYSGGAHCCTETTIHGWQQNRFTTVKTGPLDGGGRFEDVDGDRKVEFVTVDNAFFYAFSSFAGSLPPTRIYQYRPGKLINVTWNYPKFLRSHAWQIYQSIRERGPDTDINGALAGYVAQKTLLGEFQQGWNFMMARYDRKSDWGLEIYKGDKVVGKYPNFPTALKAFLINTGYLDKQGLPVKHNS